MTTKKTVLGDFDVFWTDVDPRIAPIDAALGAWIFYQESDGRIPKWMMKLDDGLTTNVAIIMNRATYDGVSAPTATDSELFGYGVGSIYVDVVNDNAYICVDSTIGAAVWKLIT